MISVLMTSGSRYPLKRKEIREAVRTFLRREGLDEVEVSLSFVGDRKIKELNKNFREIDEVTDVLSFPLEETRGEDGTLRLGDIVISYPEATRAAREENRMVDEVITRLVEHGLEHLLGRHHD